MNCVRLVRRLALIVQNGNIDLECEDASEKDNVRAVIAKLRLLQDQFTVPDSDDTDDFDTDREMHEEMEQNSG